MSAALTAKSQEAATEAHDIRLSCERKGKIVKAGSSGIWCFTRQRRTCDDDDLERRSAGFLTQFKAENMRQRHKRSIYNPQKHVLITIRLHKVHTASINYFKGILGFEIRAAACKQTKR